MRFRKKRILVTDDSQGFLLGMSVLLNKMGFNVIPAESGLEAMKLVKIMSPDLVLMDLNMPALDGLTALKVLKSETRLSSIPIVMVGSEFPDGSKERARSLGCGDFLQKPISIDDLHLVLQKYLFTPIGQTRSHLRVAFDGRVTLTVGGEDEDVYAKTLSSGGIYLRRTPPLPVGTEVGVNLKVDRDRSLALEGIVIYTNIASEGSEIPQGMAIEFREMTADVSDDLHQFVKQLLAE